jgi:DNA primase
MTESSEVMNEQLSRNLLDSNVAMSYIKSRGLSTKYIKSNMLGYCPPYSRHWFPLLKGRITVPIRDIHGRLLAFAGRQLQDTSDLTHSSFWELYPNEPAKAQDKINKWNKGKWINEPYSKSNHLFFFDISKDFVREQDHIIIVEGYFDAMILFQKGIKNVAAVCGTSLTESHLALIYRYTNNVVLLLDGDFAGENATNKIVSKVKSCSMNPFRVFLPENNDPDTFIMNYGIHDIQNGISTLIENKKEDLRIIV